MTGALWLLCHTPIRADLWQCSREPSIYLNGEADASLKLAVAMLPLYNGGMKIVIDRRNMDVAIEQLMIAVSLAKDGEGKLVGLPSLPLALDLCYEVEAAVAQTIKLWQPDAEVEFAGERI